VRPRLLQIYDDVERRARATTAEHAWWPCRRGCDACCHKLADVPRMVRAEWELLAEGLDALPPDVRAQVDARIEALAAAERSASPQPRTSAPDTAEVLGALRALGPITCPMLDEAAGACLVYAHRPAACRTYGFYVERGLGLHCAQITEAVEEAATRDEAIVWGNQEGVDGALARLHVDAQPLALTEWTRRSRATKP
jgi:Fe-S-cluster containining protein